MEKEHTVDVQYACISFAFALCKSFTALHRYDCFLMTASQFPTTTVDFVNEVEDVVEDENGCSYRLQRIATGSTARNESDADFNGNQFRNVCACRYNTVNVCRNNNL